jgi:protein-disulfide isomerase/uncharacterized membrane protein
MAVNVASPPPVPRWPFTLGLLLSALGVGLSIELTRIHSRLAEDPEYQSFCNVSQKVNCDAVTTSDFATLLGVPLSVWGILGYSVILSVAVFGLLAKTARPVLPFFVLSVFCGAASVVLSAISFFLVESLCLLCAATWGVDLLLAAVAIGLVRGGRLRSSRDQWQALVTRDPAVVAAGVLGMVVVVGVVLAVVPGAAHTGPAAARSAAPTPSAPSPSGADTNQVRRGVDDRGHHYVGAASPKLTIAEFSDYQCPHCAKKHASLRALVARHPEEVRLIHRHYPLDNDCNPAITTPFHSHACHYARLAACAGELGRFWEANDYLFENGRTPGSVTTPILAKALGLSAAELARCVEEKGNALIRPDIEVGIELKIEGTPSFVVDGKLHTGSLPAEVLAPYPMP